MPRPWNGEDEMAESLEITSDERDALKTAAATLSRGKNSTYFEDGQHYVDRDELAEFLQYVAEHAKAKS